MIPKYVKIRDNGINKVIDTSLLIPHLECYLIEENKLYCENIDGTVYLLGDIIETSDVISNMFDDEGERTL